MRLEKRFSIVYHRRHFRSFLLVVLSFCDQRIHSVLLLLLSFLIERKQQHVIYALNNDIHVYVLKTILI